MMRRIAMLMDEKSFLPQHTCQTATVELCHAGFAWVAEVAVPVISRKAIYFAAFRLRVDKGVTRTFSVLARLDFSQRAFVTF